MRSSHMKTAKIPWNFTVNRGSGYIQKTKLTSELYNWFIVNIHVCSVYGNVACMVKKREQIRRKNRWSNNNFFSECVKPRKSGVIQQFLRDDVHSIFFAIKLFTFLVELLTKMSKKTWMYERKSRACVSSIVFHAQWWQETKKNPSKMRKLKFYDNVILLARFWMFFPLYFVQEKFNVYFFLLDVVVLKFHFLICTVHFKTSVLLCFEGMNSNT